MQVSRDWIGQYVELPGDAELAKRLTSAGLAVEGEERYALSEGGEDLVFDIDITTNRPDCMNHLGLAREVAVLFDKPLNPPDDALDTVEDQAAEAASLEVLEPALCPRYNALVLEGVKIGPSPTWLRERLEAIGSRSINNVVDVTNYVLWETGQPLHAFDLDLLAGSKIRVRRAEEGEELITLDGEKRKLDPDILVIADAERAVALGGIMGGLESEVTEKTTRVLLEAAHFDPRTVRRGASKLGMHTDASHRFERGADPEACLWAARRAAALMVEVAGGAVRAGELEFKQLDTAWPPRVEIELDKLNRFGGLHVESREVETTLQGLGFGVEAKGEKVWEITAPSWRYYDFANAYPADVYEEVLRIHGFDKVESTVPQIPGHDAPASAEHVLRRRIADHLAACGLAEAISFGFYSRAEDDASANLLSDAPALALANPLSDRYAVMRRSLLPNLVSSALFNQRRGASAVQLFEIGHVFCEGAEQKPFEIETLALALGGQLGAPWSGQTELDFFDLKGILESLAEALGLEFSFRPSEVRGLEAGASAEIFLKGGRRMFSFRPSEIRRLEAGASAGILGGGGRIGYLGRLSTDDASGYPIYVAELKTASLLGGQAFIKVQAPSRYPRIEVDSTLTHAMQVPWRDLAATIHQAGVEDLIAFGLKDRYQGKGVPEGAVNTTLSFVYNSGQRSLTQDEVNERHSRLAALLNEKYGFSA